MGRGTHVVIRGWGGENPFALGCARIHSHHGTGGTRKGLVTYRIVLVRCAFLDGRDSFKPVAFHWMQGGRIWHFKVQRRGRWTLAFGFSQIRDLGGDLTSQFIGGSGLPNLA